jgi:hypothetical protein
VAEVNQAMNILNLMMMKTTSQTYSSDKSVDWYNEESDDEYCLITALSEIGDDIMIADTGATFHMRRNTEGMFDLRNDKCIVRYGHGSHSTSTVVGKWSGYIMDNGERKMVTLDDVTVVPGSAYNLFSLTRTLKEGTLESVSETRKLIVSETMKLICNGVPILLDHRIETANGFLLAAKFDPHITRTEMAYPALTVETKIRAVDLHSRLGHANDNYMRLTAKR